MSMEIVSENKIEYATQSESLGFEERYDYFRGKNSCFVKDLIVTLREDDEKCLLLISADLRNGDRRKLKEYEIFLFDSDWGLTARQSRPVSPANSDCESDNCDSAASGEFLFFCFW